MKLKFVMVPVAKVEFTEMVGVPVVAESEILVPALNDVTPMLVKVCTPFKVDMEMPLPEKLCDDEVEPFKEAMNAVLELRKSVAFFP